VIKSRRITWAGHVARIGKMRNAYSILVGKPEGKRPLGKPRRRWEDNIRMGLREIEWEGVDCIHLAQDKNQ
jgi:hypothetical protein